MIDLLASRWAYVAFVVLMIVGLYMMIASPNLVKKIIGLNVFQSAVFLFFVAAAYVAGGAPAIVPPDGGGGPYVSPLPHVIVLTAIVVGVSLTAVALALVVRIHEEYGTVDEAVLEEVADD
ncbi:cation:proton antiporter [Halobacteriales archaeon QS_4_69_225]|nr:MAG: cation:proton antiporter [Halobacteriales archaeon QS_4_69_225]PSQ36665.1 MAG: cation:proton antiporter [Halobacteriales archaeon QS_9_70_65]